MYHSVRFEASELLASSFVERLSKNTLFIRQKPLKASDLLTFIVEKNTIKV